MVNESLDEKFKKFQLKPLEFLEKMLFINLVNSDNEDMAIKYTELLIEIQKTKKDIALEKQCQ